MVTIIVRENWKCGVDLSAVSKVSRYPDSIVNIFIVSDLNVKKIYGNFEPKKQNKKQSTKQSKNRAKNRVRNRALPDG